MARLSRAFAACLWAATCGYAAPAVAAGTGCATISALQAVDVAGLSAGASRHVEGYYSAGDGGGGDFIYRPLSTAADDGGTVIPPAAGTGRWFRSFSGRLNAKWFGAKGDGVADDTRAIQELLAAAATDGVPLYVPAGTYRVGRLIYSGQSISGDGEFKTIFRGSAGSDVFYAPDPSIGEPGAVANWPLGAVIRDIGIVLDCSAAVTTNRSRLQWPVNGTWRAGASVARGAYYEVGAGNVYYAWKGGITGSVPPRAVAGMAADGSVVWYFVDSQQRTYGNAAFAFPLSDGRIDPDKASYINKTTFDHVYVTTVGSAAGGVAWWFQRPPYANQWAECGARYMTYGFVASLPAVAPNAYPWTTDTCKWSKVECFNVHPFLWFDGSCCEISGLNVYAEHVGDTGIELWPANTPPSSVPYSWVIGQLYQENNSAATGRFGIIAGREMYFANAALKTANGASYYDLLCSNSRFSSATVGNDGVSPVLALYGQNNSLENLRTTTISGSLARLVSDQGQGNEVLVDGVASTAFLSERPLAAEAGSLRAPYGLRGSEWLLKGAQASPFFDLLIGARELTATARPGARIVAMADASLETGGYLRALSAGADVPMFYAAGANLQPLSIGSRIAAGKSRVIVKARSAAAARLTGTLYAVGGAMVSLSGFSFDLTPAWKVFTVDVDTTALSGRSLQPTFDNVAGATAYVDIAWIAVVPYAPENLIVKNQWFDGVMDLEGSGPPNGSVVAPVGSTYRQADGSVGTSFWVKESGTGATGWAGDGSRVGVAASMLAGGKMRTGTATLSAGSATIADVSVAAGTRIVLGSVTPAGVPGALFVRAKTIGRGFVIASTSAADASVVAYFEIDP